jgi:uncharacterized integral membrane protein
VSEPQAPAKRRTPPWPLAVAVLVAVYAVLFVVLNTHSARVSFVFASTRISVIWVILLSIGVGFVLGMLVPQLYRRRQRRR